jgi:hypothetical protein
MLRRMVLVVTVVAVMAAMMLVMAMPAFAEARSPVANCVGELASHAEPGTKGQVVSEGAKSDKGAVGELVKSLAREAEPRGEEPCSLG